jgi:hypothetical protein
MNALKEDMLQLVEECQQQTVLRVILEDTAMAQDYSHQLVCVILATTAVGELILQLNMIALKEISVYQVHPVLPLACQEHTC